MSSDAADAAGESECPNDQGAVKSTPEKAPDTGGIEEPTNPATAKTNLATVKTFQGHRDRKLSQEKNPKDRKPKKRKPGFHEDMFEETSYYFKKGLRFVYPYKFTFTAHAKLRWMGLKVIDVFNKEFHMETVEYYKKAIKTGKIRVNGKPVAEDYILKNGDILQTMVHRHEPPVVNEPIEFIRNDEEIVVINKPSSIPVHPCGRYRHNTVVFLLGKEHHLKGLHTVHRIDRLTSGILMFAKTSSKAKGLEAAVKGRLLEKEYLARVRGEFPVGEITVNEPIITASHKVGVCHVDETGKECTTIFKRLHYNGGSSVVVCKPLTGRMHQIRVHLQWLGFPIINDPIYNHSTAWGENKGKHGSPPNMDEVIAELLRTRKDNSYDFDLNTDKPNAHFKLERAPPAKKVKTESIDKNLDHISDHIQSLTSTMNSDLTEKYVRSTDIKQDGNKTTEEEKAYKIKTIQNARETQTKDVSIKCSCEDPSNSHIQEDGPSPIEIKPKNNSRENVNTEGNTLNVTANKEEINESPSNRGTGHVTYTSRELGEQYFDEDCTECKRTWKEPFLSELVMYLHAYSYKGSDFHYTTSIPDWAKEEWKE